MIQPEEPKILEWSDDHVTRFWNVMSRFPERYFTHQSGDLIVDYFIPHLLDRKVLDYGCGRGALLKELLDRGLECAGADISTQTVEMVRTELGGRVGFAGARRPNEWVESGQAFGAVTCIEVVEHLDDKKLDLVVGDIYSLLAPGGRLLLTTPNEENLNDALVYCPESNKLFHPWQHVRSWGASGLSNYLESRSFKTISLEATWIHREPPLPWYSKLKARLVPPPPHTHKPNLCGVFEKV